MFAVALTFLLITASVSWYSGVPIRDPEGSLFGKRILLPAFLMVVFFGLDMARRGHAIWSVSDVRPKEALRKVFLDRWWPGRLRIAFAGFWTFHISYLSYRNLKSFVPVVNHTTYDESLTRLDEWMMFGREPAKLLQDLLGRDFSAHILSSIYLAFIPFVPISIAVALMFSEQIRNGYYYVSAAVFNWILGTASYFLLPSLGPFGTSQHQFSQLAHTNVERVQNVLIAHRFELRADPIGSGDIQSVAGFASLHISIVLTALFVCWQLRMRNWAIFFTLAFIPTAISTIYFGWHYIVDDIAGVVIAVMAITFAKWAVFPRSTIAAQVAAHDLPTVGTPVGTSETVTQ